MKFILNQQIVDTPLPSGMATVDYLRETAGLLGTKVGCREGDCGACTVLLGTLEADTVTYRAVNSCLLPLGKAAGCHLVTIEGLNQSDLSPVQQAIVDEGATQCGFCTPGIVLSATAALWQSLEPQKMEQAVFGNICRCTGYASIKRAIRRMPPVDTTIDRLDALIDHGSLPAYFKDIKDQLQILARATAEVNNDDIAPVTSDTPTIVGGGTDLMVQRPEHMTTHSIRFSNTAMPAGIQQTRCPIEQMGNRIVIFGAATFDELAASPLIQTIDPTIENWMIQVASPQIRQVATVAGNIANASPIGDITLWLLALDADLTLTSESGERTVRLCDFFKGYKTIDLKKDEIITQISLDAAPPDGISVERVAKRTHMDIASVSTVCAVRHQNGVVNHVALSAGGVGPVPLRLEKTAQHLTGRAISWQTALSVGAVARSEVTPISDVRGSATYKSRLLERLVIAHFVTLFGVEGALP